MSLPTYNPQTRPSYAAIIATHLATLPKPKIITTITTTLPNNISNDNSSTSSSSISTTIHATSDPNDLAFLHAIKLRDEARRVAAAAAAAKTQTKYLHLNFKAQRSSTQLSSTHTHPYNGISSTRKSIHVEANNTSNNDNNIAGDSRSQMTRIQVLGNSDELKRLDNRSLGRTWGLPRSCSSSSSR
jgi:hypothetical protein